MKCFHGWWSYLKLALPSVGACCLEWWLYEGLILMAGWFPNADVAVAAMGVGFNTTALTYTISQGVGGERNSHMRCAVVSVLQNTRQDKVRCVSRGDIDWRECH